ncbi:MAG: benzoyl-CoA reductase, bzd-type, subunit O [Candidatus Bathyarchaeota archaeon]|nr:MAG: benzoyl-CoA reductase, bzd-type, subunit O [Candidatus Bathyarchaeota archaeon]
MKVTNPVKKYPTEPLKCWNEAKSLRTQYYENYLHAHKNGGLRWAGGAWSFSSVPAGLGDDVHSVTGEPYGATIAFHKDFASECHDAVEAAGFPRTLCAYMRNYWGAILLDKFILADGRVIPGYPTPDFIWQDHICCSHGKWYEIVKWLEKKKGKEIPMFCTDVSVGYSLTPPEKFRVDYIVNQLQDGILWLEKVTGRTYNDQLLCDAVWNEMKSTSLWAEVCALNQVIPTPIDEKTMYSLYVIGTLMKHRPECAAFYEKLRDEVQNRVDRGIAAIPHERFRVITDTQPPWGFLKIFRAMENYGVVSLGSLYSFGLIGMWEYQPDGKWIPKPLPSSKPATREEALRAIVEWTLNRPEWAHFYRPELKTQMMKSIVQQWKANAVLLHYNRGCEGLSVHIAENRLGLLKDGIQVFSFEGNMGDEREFDYPGTMARVTAFFESMGLEKLSTEGGP